MELTIEDIENVQKQIDELKAKLEADKFKALKKAYSEGAVIEHRNSVDEHRWRLSYANKPDWTALEYRIKDSISIHSWQVHKDLIKQYWDGAEIEFSGCNKWNSSTPSWDIDCLYRVKPTTWKLPEYEDGSEWVASFDGMVTCDIYESYTKAGRRRATKELALRCAKASKERDLLEAWRDHLEPEYLDPDWSNEYEEKYSIVLHLGKYQIQYSITVKSLGTVYGSKETMQKICEALNNKEISLD